MSTHKRSYFTIFASLLLVMLVACAPLSPTATPPAETIPPQENDSSVPADPDAADEYVDPDGLFSAPIPTNWEVEQQEGYAIFTSPEGDIAIYLLAVQAEDAESAVEAGWQRVDPGFDQPVGETLNPPPASGVEASLVVNYEFDEENEQVYQAVAQLYEGLYYLLLVDGDLSGIQRRQAQLNIIGSGFTIEALAETDLTGVEPLPVRDLLPELEEFIETQLTHFKIPGAAVAIVQDGEVVYSQGFGVTEQGSNTPITPETHMMIGSTGKSLTTMLMGTLVDAGQMDWDTPVVEVLPEFAVADPELTESITMRNLVCACTGVPRRDFELLFNADELSAEDIVDSLATFEFFTDFGEAFQYSNQMVATGGYATAAADGAEYGNLFESYVDSLQRRVLDPIGMENTTVSFAQVRERDAYATPHSLSFDASYKVLPLEFEEILTPIAPAGAHWSTLEDMTQYLLTELATGVAPDGTRVISKENLRETWKPQVPVGAEADYGLGWFVSDYHGLQLIDHGGNTLGFTSSFGFLPEVDLGIIVLTNAQGTNYFNEGVRQRLLELVFEQEAETETAMQFAFEQILEATERPEGLQDAVDPAAVDAHLGIYANEALGQVEIRWENDALIADVGEFASPLLPLYSEDDPEELEGYVVVDPPLFGALFEFAENDAGEPILAFGQGAVSYTFEKVE